jgi:hypothetical protein
LRRRVIYNLSQSPVGEISVRILPALVLAATLAAGVPAAHANLTAVFNSRTGISFDYTLRFTVDQTGEALRAGDFITIYDLGTAPTITSATAPAGFAVSFASTGTTPPGVITPAIVDDPGLLNVTFTYTGATRTTAFDFTGATIETNLNTTGTRFGKAAGTTSFNAQGDQVSTNVTTVPAPIPEPAALALFSLGGLALLARRRS